MIRNLGLCLLAFGLLSGCSSTEELEPEVVEIPTTAAPLDGSPEFELFERGKRLYQANLYIVAKDAFQSLRDAYPLGPYTEFAEIKLADAEFELKNYLEAALLYEDLAKNRPSSQALPYITLMVARSYQLANRGIGRDNEPLQKSFEYYNNLLNKYPGSMYTDAARSYRAEVEKLIARNQKEILDFYLRQEKLAAYEARRDAFQKRWGTLKIEQIESADTQPRLIQTAPRVQTASLLSPAIVYAGRKSHDPPAGFAPSVLDSADQGSSISPDQTSRASLAHQLPKAPATSAAQGIRQVECKQTENAELIILHLFRLPKTSADFPKRIEPDETGIRVDLQEATNAVEFSCSSGEQIEIGSNGEINISTDRTARAFTLTRPPRIVFSFNNSDKSL